MNSTTRALAALLLAGPLALGTAGTAFAADQDSGDDAATTPVVDVVAGEPTSAEGESAAADAGEPEAAEAVQDAAPEAGAADLAAAPAEAANNGLLVPQVLPPGLPATGVTYGTMTLSPSGPYTSGQVVTVTYKGLTPPDNNAGGGFFIGVCVGGGKEQGGPNACTKMDPNEADGIDGTWYKFGPSSLPDGSVKLTIPDQGADAGFVDYPGWKCDNGAGNECNIAVGDFRGNGPTQIPITYGAATGGGAGSGGDSGSSTDGNVEVTVGGSDTGTDGSTSGTGSSLAATGPQENVRLFSLAAVFLLMGAILLLNSSRGRGRAHSS